MSGITPLPQAFTQQYPLLRTVPPLLLEKSLLAKAEDDLYKAFQETTQKVKDLRKQIPVCDQKAKRAIAMACIGVAITAAIALKKVPLLRLGHLALGTIVTICQQISKEMDQENAPFREIAKPIIQSSLMNTCLSLAAETLTVSITHHLEKNIPSLATKMNLRIISPTKASLIGRFLINPFVSDCISSLFHRYTNSVLKTRDETKKKLNETIVSEERRLKCLKLRMLQQQQHRPA